MKRRALRKRYGRSRQRFIVQTQVAARNPFGHVFYSVVDTKTGRVMGRTDTYRDKGPPGATDWAKGLAETQADALNMGA